MLDWTQILSVINLQRQRGTAPQSRVSSRQHVSPGENTVYTCVCVCVQQCITISANTPNKPPCITLQPASLQVSPLWSALLKDMNVDTLLTWHAVLFEITETPKVPEDDDGPPNQMRVYSWFHRRSGGNPPSLTWTTILRMQPMNS